MDQKKLKSTYMLMVAHLKQANEIAARLAVHLDPVEGPAPSGVSRRKKELKTSIKASVSAQRMKHILKHQPR